MIRSLNNTQNTTMTTLLFDLETTGLLRRGSQLHCIVARDMSDVDNPLVYDYRPDQALDLGVERLRRADCLVGHNICGFDIPMIKELYDFDFQGETIDTLVLSRLFYPNIQDRDYEIRPAGMPQRLYGRHSLEAWGYRLKCFKGDYGKGPDAWDKYTPEMLDYCIQDTLVTVRLFELMQRRMNDYAN